MSRSVNRATILGRVGADPDIRTTQGGTKVAGVSVATGRKWKDRNGAEQESTQWHRVTLWDRLAEIAEQYLRKGDRVLIEGRIEYREDTDRDGNKRYFTDIVAQEMILLGGAGEREEVVPMSQRGLARQGAPAPGPFDDDPF